MLTEIAPLIEKNTIFQEHEPLILSEKILLKGLRIRKDEEPKEFSLQNILMKEYRMNQELTLAQKLNRFFINNEDLFDQNKSCFEYRLFTQMKEMIKKKTTEQKLKFIFVKIYQYLEEKLLNKIQYNVCPHNQQKYLTLPIKKNSDEFNNIFNLILFDNRRLKKSNFRIYNPKKKILRFNYRFIKMIFQNKIFKINAVRFLNNSCFEKEIYQDIFSKIDMIINLVKLNRFKSEQEFFKFFTKRTINKIPWKIDQANEAKEFFLEKINFK